MTVFELMFDLYLIWVVPILVICMLLLCAVAAVLWMFRENPETRIHKMNDEHPAVQPKELSKSKCKCRQTWIADGITRKWYLDYRPHKLAFRIEGNNGNGKEFLYYWSHRGKYVRCGDLTPPPQAGALLIAEYNTA